MTHLDLRAATAKQVRQLRFVEFEVWFPPRRDERAAVVVEATERAERGDARCGVIIADQLAPDAQDRLREIERLHGSPPRTVMMAGRHLAIEEPQHQGESQQEPQQQPPPAEPQPA